VNGNEAAVFTWQDFSRFVRVAPVTLGWLVIWGTYADMGNVRHLSGQRTYATLEGARRRVADSAFELTRDAALANEALTLFDRTDFPEHLPSGPPVPV
jgi:hypothetical protein